MNNDIQQTEIDDEQQIRGAAWGLLAALLRKPPNSDLLKQAAGLAVEGGPVEGDNLSETMHALGEAAATADSAQLEEEYNNLFIGLGRGELNPYGSWYMTGFLMEKPLADLREDMAELGFERNPEYSEPEDHIASTLEIYSAMILYDSWGGDQQKDFFERHMQPWIARFFSDLEKAKTAAFFRAVARFATELYKLERQYLDIA